MAAGKQDSESAAQLFARLGKKHCLSGLDTQFFRAIPNGLCPKDSIELYGEEGSGKTEIFIHLCVKCILPGQWKGLSLNGKESKVIYIDTEYKFPLWRVVKILENHYRIALRNDEKAGENKDNFTACEVDEFVQCCLERLFICRCFSSLNLAKSLAFMDSLLHANPDICMLIIDSISSFYWTDRTIGGTTRTDQEANQREIIQRLKKLQEVYHIVVLVSKSAIMNPNYHATSNTLKNNNTAVLTWKHDMYLSNEWNRFIKYKYLIKKNDTDNCKTTYSAYLLKDPPFHEAAFTVTETGLEFV